MKVPLLLLALLPAVQAFQPSVPNAGRINAGMRHVSALRMAAAEERPISAGNLAGDTSGKGLKVTVVGGSGFVGSRVCKILVDCGADVTSVSKSGQAPKWASGQDWVGAVDWKAVDLLGGDEAALDAAVGSPDAVVSTVGVVGTDLDVLLKGNGDTNAAAFASCKRKGVSRIAYVSVAEEVAACQENWLPEFFSGYFDGKVIAEAAALEALGGDSSQLCLVKPTFIYGGDSFELLPPRVTYDYGSGIEQLLSFGLIKIVADVTPGLIKVALRPPVSVDSVASACAAAALGKESANGKVLDGTKAINGSTDQPDATGLSEAFEWTKDNAIKFYNWAKEKIEGSKKD